MDDSEVKRQVFQEIDNAIRQRDPEKIKKILSNMPAGTDIQQVSNSMPWKSQYTAISLAVQFQNIEVLECLVAYVRSKGTIIQPGLEGNNSDPISIAIDSRNEKLMGEDGKDGFAGERVLNKMLELSTDAELASTIPSRNFRDTRWHYAAAVNAQAVFDHPKFKNRLAEILPNCLNEQGRTPFHVAAAKGHRNLIEKLSASIPELVCLEDHQGKTALHLALEEAKSGAEVAQFILENHPKCVAVGKPPPYLIRGQLDEIKKTELNGIFEIMKEIIISGELWGGPLQNSIGGRRKLLYGESGLDSGKDLFLDLSIFDRDDYFEDWLREICYRQSDHDKYRFEVAYESCLLEVKLPELRYRKDGRHRCIMSETKLGSSLPANIVFGLLKEKGVRTIVKVDVRDCLLHPHSDSNVIQCLRNFVVRKLDWRRADMGIEVLLQAAPDVEEITLYYTCNEEVLHRWTGYEGLRRLKKLKHIKIKIIEKEFQRLERDSGTITEESFKKNILDRFAEICHHNHLVQLTYDSTTRVLQKSQPCPNTCPCSPESNVPPESIFQVTIVSKENLDHEDDMNVRKNGSYRSDRTFYQKMENTIRALINLGGPQHRDKPAVDYLLKHKTKVAVIDCGADASKLSENQDLTGKSFMEDGGFKNEYSASHWHTVTNPHGTQAASIIRKMDPFSHLFIAKVDHEGVEISAVIEAVKWAIENNVDIISISWTGPQGIADHDTSRRDFENILRKAASEILVFCATGDPEDGVSHYPASWGDIAIPIASTVSAGKYLFPTKGIEAQQPSYLPPENFTGSSAATAVAAGFASLILSCARYSYHGTSDFESKISIFRTRDRMRKMFTELSSSPDHRDVHPEHLFEINGVEDMSPSKLQIALKAKLSSLLERAEKRDRW